MKKWLFNPFVYIAGAKALAIGGVIMVVSSVIVSTHNGHFDGAMDVHFGAKTNLLQAICEPLVSWLSLVLALYLFGRIASESAIRFIDVAGTTALARWPMLPISLLGLIPQPDMPEPNKMTLEAIMKIATSPGVIIEGLLSLPLIVWFIALLYNAYSVSANLKGSKAVWSFIGGLVAAEIVSKVVLYLAF